VVFIVSAFPSADRDKSQPLADAIRRRLPQARLVTLFLPGMPLEDDATSDGIRDADNTATSFGQAVQICLAMQNEATKSGTVHEA
jgi:hypothetical protein